MIKEIIKNIQQCDDFHNRCDYLLEHDEATHLIEYITNLEKENKELHNKIDKTIELYKNCKAEDYCTLDLDMYNALIGGDVDGRE